MCCILLTPVELDALQYSPENTPDVRVPDQVDSPAACTLTVRGTDAYILLMF
jgi:hypothetical protein